MKSFNEISKMSDIEISEEIKNKKDYDTEYFRLKDEEDEIDNN